MRSLIILEVEHGEGTDGLDFLIELAQSVPLVEVTNYTVRVDLPACFVLDSDS